MENPRNRSHCGGGEDGENRQSINDSLDTDQFLSGLLRNSSSIDRSRGQNLTEINQPAAGAEQVGQQQSDQRHPADLSSADSHHSKRNIPEDSVADPRARKRAYDKAYRERLKESQERTKSKLETVERENENLLKENESLKRENETLSKELNKLKKKHKKQHENEQQIMSNPKTLEALKTENEALSKKLDELKKKYQKQQENEQEMKFNLETLEIENSKLKEKYKKQRESKRQLRSRLKKVEAEKERLMDRIFESHDMWVHRRSETQSNDLAQIRSKLDNLEKELVSTKASSYRASLAGSNINFIGGFEQDFPNVETDGSRRSSQTTTTATLPSSPAFLSGATSPATGSPPSSCRFEYWNGEQSVPAFKEFKLAELRAATNEFSSDLIVSNLGEKAPNKVYRGKLKNNRLVAIKRFSKLSWPDRKQFLKEAAEVGKIQHKRLVNLIGCCAEGDERLLVAEYMPNDNLSKHLFHWEEKPLPWEMRVRVAYYIAQALDHCNTQNRKIYHDLHADRVLFDEDGNPQLSSFGLMKNSRDGKRYGAYFAYTPPEVLQTGRVIPESVIYSYGTVLLDLLSGQHIPPDQAMDLIKGKNLSLLMDSSLEGQYANGDASELVELASKCLQNESRDRPDIKFLLSTVAPLQKQKEVASRVLMGLYTAPVLLPTKLSPLGEACAKKDLTAAHDILLKNGYREEEERLANELSFEDWTQDSQEILETRKCGNTAFRDKDFQNAIDYYSKVVAMMSKPCGTVLVRRAFSYLMIGQSELALGDATKAQLCLPDWPTAHYMQALALSKLGMETDAQDSLNEGAFFEAKR
ncbi:hypothetical protein SLEP1_g18130 [Rubroshorea leprosula]|uniref:non-specific serine/threonine protein kinase n=1 Tax=Rubroshorea leprosula TaxID=152421 RepID=A0AAV5J2E1_9ROSI|nr:hypothetical protein SLEP1_g18130 [Rubroshorea leprosula]